MRRHLPLLLALLLVAGGQTEVWIADAWRGPKPIDALVALAPLGLIWMRERPLLVAVVIGGLYGLDTLVFGSPASITMFFTVTITVFWTAVIAPPGKFAVLAGGAALLAMTQIRDPETLDPGSRVFPFVFLALTWAVGTMVHGRQRLAAAQAERADRAEAEQAAVAHAAALDERVRIAREMHDIVAHSVSVMVIQAVAGRKTLAAGRDGADGAFDAIETTGQQALTEMRRLLGVLRDAGEGPTLVPQPGLAQLGSLVDQAILAGLNVTCSIEGDVRPLPPGTDLSAYRIVQEALTNVLKHAPGSQTEVRATYGERDIELVITDDGAGPGSTTTVPEGAATGHGIAGMHERAALFDGTLRAEPTTGGGFSVHARLPTTATAP